MSGDGVRIVRERDLGQIKTRFTDANHGLKSVLGFHINRYLVWILHSHALVWLRRIQMGHLKENCCNGQSFIQKKKKIAVVGSL
jgi:hypothetical protein